MPGTAGGRGFTLLEMTLVVVILIVLAAIAVPGFRAALDASRLESSAAMVASKLGEARIHALKRSRPTWLAIDVAKGVVQVQTTAPGGAVVDVEGPGILSGGIGFVDPPAAIPFDALGRPSDPPPHVVTLATASGTRRRITVSAAGIVAVE